MPTQEQMESLYRRAGRFRDVWNSPQLGGKSPLAAGPSSTSSGLPYPLQVEEAAKMLARDQGKLAGSSTPTYRGANAAPMSALTQKSREYQNEFATKGVPYANKAQKIDERSKSGLSSQQLQGLLDNWKQGQTSFNQGALQNNLQKQFGSNLSYIQGNLDKKSNKDIARYGDTVQRNLGEANVNAANTDQSHNRNLTQLLQSLGLSKQMRREDLVKTLADFGGQEQAIGNMRVQADRNKFNQEANQPYDNIRKLQQLIQGQGGGADELHPDIAAMKGRELQQGIKAYGTAQPNYQGNRVAGINPQLQNSFDTMERVGPKTRDSGYVGVRSGVNELMGSGNLSEQALARLPEHIRIPLQEMEYAAKKRNKDDLNRLGQQYIRNNSYGSGAHMKDAARASREIQEALMKQRETLLRSGFGEQLGQAQQRGENTILNTQQSAQRGNTDYANMMNNIRSDNRTGQNIFNNQQDEEDQLYKNYQTEWANRWPQNRAMGVLGGGGVGGGAMAEPALDRNNRGHSESVLAPQQAQPAFANTNQVQQNMVQQQQQSAQRQQQQQQQQSADELARYNEQYRLDQINKDRLARTRNIQPAMNNVRDTGEHLRGIGYYNR